MPTGRHETLHLTLGSGKPPEPIICRNFILINMFVKKMTLQQVCHQVIMQVPSRAEGVIGENRTWEILHTYQPNDENELKTYCLENLMHELTCIRCGKTLTLKIQTVKNACKVQPKLNVMSQEMSKMDIRCLWEKRHMIIEKPRKLNGARTQTSKKKVYAVHHSLEQKWDRQSHA